VSLESSCGLIPHSRMPPLKEDGGDKETSKEIDSLINRLKRENTLAKELIEDQKRQIEEMKEQEIENMEKFEMQLKTKEEELNSTDTELKTTRKTKEEEIIKRDQQIEAMIVQEMKLKEHMDTVKKQFVIKIIIILLAII
jgi:hypothetical protein